MPRTARTISDLPRSKRPMGKYPAGEAQPIYDLTVTLRHIQPPIWRRLHVRSDTTLAKLHHVLQVAMGWTNSHLHMFVSEAEGEQYGMLDPEGELVLRDERRFRLDRLLTRPGNHLCYEYDSATPGSTTSSWSASSTQNPAPSIPGSSQASVPVHPRIVEGCRATRGSWASSPTQATRNTRKRSSGPAARSTRRGST